MVNAGFIFENSFSTIFEKGLGKSREISEKYRFLLNSMIVSNTRAYTEGKTDERYIKLFWSIQLETR